MVSVFLDLQVLLVSLQLHLGAFHNFVHTWRYSPSDFLHQASVSITMASVSMITIPRRSCAYFISLSLLVLLDLCISSLRRVSSGKRAGSYGKRPGHFSFRRACLYIIMAAHLMYYSRTFIIFDHFSDRAAIIYSSFLILLTQGHPHFPLWCLYEFCFPFGYESGIWNVFDPFHKFLFIIHDCICNQVGS